MLEAIKETISFIRQQINTAPETAIILGTGLGDIADEIEVNQIIPYEDIPNFPVSTVEGHDGKLIVGRYAGKEVFVLKGRFHFYEGYTMQEVTFPIRVMKFLGVKNLLISNAAGGMNPDFEIGDVMFINDHINLMPNPLLGKHIPEFGDRFPDMSEIYEKDWIALAVESAMKYGLRSHTGCYVAVTGPTLETQKEYEYFRIIGGDTVGMSTVPEAIVAHQMGIKIFAVSVVTDLGVPGKIIKISHKIVQEAATRVTPKLVKIIHDLIKSI